MILRDAICPLLRNYHDLSLGTVIQLLDLYALSTLLKHILCLQDD